jgi:gamma-F420-2:alpha-L-glutamate ligase
MKVWLLQNPGPETYEVESIAKSLAKKQIDVDCKMISDMNGLPDIAILRNTRGADYSKLNLMKNRGVKFINDLDGHYLASDKWKKYEKLMHEGLRVPKTLLIPIPFTDQHIEKIGDEINFPCVIKRRYGAYGIGVELCQDAEHMFVIANRFSKQFGDRTMIAQRYVNYSGDYMALMWVGGIYKAHVAKAPEGDMTFLSYQKPEHTSSRTPYAITNDLRKTVEPVMQSLGLDLARLDLLFDKDGYIICEVNSPGGFRGFEMVHKIDMGDIISDYIIRIMT